MQYKPGRLLLIQCCGTRCRGVGWAHAEIVSRGHTGLSASHHAAGFGRELSRTGNNRQAVFFVEEDRTFYIETLREQCERSGLAVEAYCLMDNHVHIVAVPAGEASLAKALGRTNLYYTRYVNRLHGPSGQAPSREASAARACGRGGSSPARWTRRTSGRRWCRPSAARFGRRWFAARGFTPGRALPPT